MAVVDYRVNGARVVVRNFEPPKRAGELKYWYRAARKAAPQLPEFAPYMIYGADITVETIILAWETTVERHHVFIARKRRLL